MCSPHPAPRSDSRLKIPYDISMQYVDDDQYLPPVQNGDDTFSFTLPQNVSIADVESVSYKTQR